MSENDRLMEEFLFQSKGVDQVTGDIPDTTVLPASYIFRIRTKYPTDLFQFLHTMKKYQVRNCMVCICGQFLRIQCLLRNVAVSAIFGDDTMVFELPEGMEEDRVYGHYDSTTLKSLASITPRTVREMTFERNSDGNLQYSVEQLHKEVQDSIILEMNQSICIELRTSVYSHMHIIPSSTFKSIVQAMPSVFRVQTLQGNNPGYLTFIGFGSSCKLQLHVCTDVPMVDASVCILKRDIEICLAYAKHSLVVCLGVRTGEPLCCIFPSVLSTGGHYHRSNSTRTEIYIQPYAEHIQVDE